MQATMSYIRGGQLVFDWDRLEKFLITRDRPLGNKVTSTKRYKMQRFSYKWICMYRRFAIESRIFMFQLI